MNLVMSILISLLMIGGALFALAAAIGILRLPDVYTRMHAAAKAGTVGSGLLLLAAGVGSSDPAILARSIAGFAFFILTAPVSAHLLARAAHIAGIKLTDLTVRDDYAVERNQEEQQTSE